ncbi:Nitrogen fixation protein RnfD [Salinivirga cyanobacteriivorans]|uniref:Ion-translocating oxidoreductase complex subunit D n=1 Tax=Salinivirga cyanobacteriivorans TaxID=1307839 RepID=A0A0S2I5B6_9BACT|nr:RnfABCDGE type electron transport complex subunit D [Salinivirga cyanobacteriivorans]ALO17503.1 Nitrogen fixation protein RnfD [Salinivirga cyanobacteriivorans]
MNRLLTVSPSPHVKGHDSVRSIMYGVVISLIPALGVAVYFFGLDALKLTLIAVASSMFFEWLIQKFLIKESPRSAFDGSAIITGMLLAFNVPSSLPIWMMIVGSLVAIGVGKMSFGGLGKNIFNPALVGRVFMLISWPVEMTTWPNNRFHLADGYTGATPLGMLKEGLQNNEPMSQVMDKLPTALDYFVGNMSGCIGEVSALALLIGGIYMVVRKIINWQTPVTIFATVFIFAAIMRAINPELYPEPTFHLLTGGLFIGAIYMATDMVSSPMTIKGQVIFGVGIGIITLVIRYWGAYPEGVSFAILIMNATVPIIDRYTKPKRFGEEVKNG